jgi:hypothetical protein
MKHTKGPWIVSDERESYLGPESGSFEVSGPSGIICVTDESYAPEAEANAHLIAAAPELLEALLQAQGYVGEYCEHHDCRVSTELYAKIDTLIAKARGEA